MTQADTNARARRPGTPLPPAAGWLERGRVTSTSPLAVQVAGMTLTGVDVKVSPDVTVAVGPVIIATFGAAHRTIIARGA